MFWFEKPWEYHDLSLKLDIILLKATFHNFRETCCNYKLVPVYYISAQSLAKPASLKEDKQKLELVKYQETFELYEKIIRRGISIIRIDLHFQIIVIFMIIFMKFP